jgi:polysaccharide pyruvyl transferase WcaK-like protein
MGRDEVSPARQVRSALKKVAGCIPLVLPSARRLRDGCHALLLEARHLKEAGRILQGLDGLIVAGGGQFDDEFGGAWGHPFAMFNWTMQAARRRIPVFFLGVGVCEVRSVLTGWFLRVALGRSRRTSLRDAGSIEILRRLGFEREVHSCPDLAFGLPLTDNAATALDEGDAPRRIGLSPIVFGHPGSWPTESAVLFDRYRHELTELAAAILRAGHSLTLFTTADADYALAKGLRDRLAVSAPGDERLRLLPRLKLPELLASLRTFDAVIASRLHGVLLSHVSGVPVLGISYHRKVRVHMTDMEQQKFCLDFESFTASEALSSLNDLLAERAVIASELRRVRTVKYNAVEKEFAAVEKELASRLGAYRARP